MRRKPFVLGVVSLTISYILCLFLLLPDLMADNSAENSATIQSRLTTASFVGNEPCAACHETATGHWLKTVHAKVFDGRLGANGQTLGCESCHGPGSRHVEDPSLADSIIRFSSRSVLPVSDLNEVCLSCHLGGKQLHWFASAHESAELACSDCHNPMANVSTSGLLAQKTINDTCFSCHQQQKIEFHKRSHMPLPEGKMTCLDCHSPHGSTTESLLTAPSINETCYECHADKRGPFLFEHAPVQENCSNCHTPHGSNHEALLITPRPVLCQQCHTMLGHMNDLLTQGHLGTGSSPDIRAMGRSCQNCHTQIHGSNHPSGAKFHR